MKESLESFIPNTAISAFRAVADAVDFRYNKSSMRLSRFYQQGLQEVYSMKKKLALLLAGLLLFGSAACGTNETPEAPVEEEIQTEIRLEECGLAYTIPDAWVETDNTNLFPITQLSAESAIYAKIQYNYAPDEALDDLNDINSTVPVEDLMTPIAEFLVVRTQHLAAESVQKEMALFSTVEELPAQENFHFYFLSNYADGTDHFSDEAQETFETLEEALPELKDSIETFQPDEEAVRAQAEEDSKYLNFMTNTLEGDAIASTIFHEYDLTMVNFWATYCDADGINELDTLQAFYTELQKKHPNVNFIQVVIDTPDPNAEAAAIKAYEKAGVTFTGIMPDQNLANWIMANLNGLPTTIFVDGTGKPSTLKIEGLQDAAYYMETTETMLETVDTEEETE